MPFVYEIDSPGVCSPRAERKATTYGRRAYLASRSDDGRGCKVSARTSLRLRGREPAPDLIRGRERSERGSSSLSHETRRCAPRPNPLPASEERERIEIVALTESTARGVRGTLTDQIERNAPHLSA